MACWNTYIEELDNGNIYINSGSRSNSYFGKFWVAKILGTDPKYGFKREFVNDKDGAVIKDDGIYQVYRTCAWAKRPEDYFLEVKENNFKYLSKQKVLGKF